MLQNGGTNRQINPDINRIEQGLLDKHYLRKHGKDATTDNN